MSGPSNLPPVPTDHPDRDLLYQLEDALRKLQALPGDDWDWTVLRVGTRWHPYVEAILEHRETLAFGSVCGDDTGTTTGFGFHVLCENAPGIKETETWSKACALRDAFGDLGKVGFYLLTRSFVADETAALCRGFISHAPGTFWMFFVAGLSQQELRPVQRIPRVWQFESEAGLQTLEAADLRNLAVHALIPDLPKDWIESPPDDYFSFVLPAFGRTSLRVGRWLFDRILEESPVTESRPPIINRQQKKTAESVVCSSVDGGSIGNEEANREKTTTILEKLRDGFERAGHVAFDIEGWLVVTGRTADVTIPEFESKCFITIHGGTITIGTDQSDVQAYTRLATRAGRELQRLHNPDEACQWWTETVFEKTGQRKLKVGNVTVPVESLEQLGSIGHEHVQKVRERIGTPSGWFSHLPDMLDASVQTIDVLLAELHRPTASTEPPTSQLESETQSSSKIPPEYLDSDGERLTAERMAFLLDVTRTQFNRWVAGTSDCPYLAEGTRVVGHKFQGVRPKLFLKSTLDTLLAGKKRADRKLKR